MAWLSVYLFIALLTLLATCRITRLITEDTLTKPIRDHVAARATPRPGRRVPRAWRWADKLLTCAWCSGFWVSVATVGGYFACWLGEWPWTGWDHAFAYAVAVFACSWASALLADWLDAPPPPRVVTLTAAPLDVTVRQGPDNTSL